MRPLDVAMLVGLLLLNAPAICRGKTPEKVSEASVVRSWSDSTGRFHMEGFLLSADLSADPGADRSQVHLQKVHGSVITVAIDQLSAEDRRFVLNSFNPPVTPENRSGPSVAGNAGRPTGGPADWMTDLKAGWSAIAIPAVGDMSAVAIAGQLMGQSAPPMPENAIYVRLSRQFLERMALHDVSQHAAVNDTVLGYKVVGVSQTVGSMEFELKPSDQCGLAEIHLFGTTTYDTVADAGPIRVLTSGVTRFASAKALRFDELGIHLGAAATNAQTSSKITGIQTSLPGLRGRIALRIGGRRAGDSRLAAAAITAEHTSRQVNQGFDASASKDVADLCKTIGAQMAALPADDPLRQCSWQASSTKDALQIIFLAPPADKDGRVPAPSPMLADAEVEVQVHVAMVRRAMADVRLQKLLQPVAVQLASMPGKMPAGRPMMRWSNDHNWLSLSWQSGDRPAEPAASGAAILASQGR